MRAFVRWSLPERSRRELRLAARRIRHFGRQRFCPVCGSRCSAFLPDARTGRLGAACPVCGSRERHRSIWPFLVEETPIARAPLRVLHVAPEGCFERRLRRLGLGSYVTLDLARGDVALRGDLSRLGLASGSFDLALCNHVLEHVPDDRAAMRELYRVLAPGGWAVLTVPYSEKRPETLEDPDARSPEDRLRRYGHPGHVRLYGADLADRLRAAGFAVARRDYGAEAPEAEKRRRGVFASYPIFVCRKPGGDGRRPEPGSAILSGTSRPAHTSARPAGR